MNNPAQLLLSTQFEVEDHALSTTINHWYDVFGNDTEKCCLYEDNKNNALVELRVLPSLSSIEEELCTASQLDFQTKVKDSLVSDWRRQCLELKDTVIPQANALPDTPFVQLRRIEVPLQVYDEYMDWRESTIFDYSKKHPQIESFLAYHTVLSTTPGVVFICGFSCELEAYLNVFAHPDFQAISAEAKEKYIYAGVNGLYTNVFTNTRRLSHV